MFYFVTNRQSKRNEKKYVKFYFFNIITITGVHRKWYRWRCFIMHVLTSSDLIKITLLALIELTLLDTRWLKAIFWKSLESTLKLICF